MLYEDHQGTDLPGVDAAVVLAKQDAREIMRDEPNRLAIDRWIEVVDEGGNTLNTVPFEALARWPDA